MSNIGISYGHLNLDILDKNNQATKEIVNTLKPLGLRQIIKEPLDIHTTKTAV